MCADRQQGDEVVGGRYRIERKLGDGTSGTTYEATDTSTGALLQRQTHHVLAL